MNRRPGRRRALRPVEAPAAAPRSRSGVRRRAQPRRCTNRDAVEKIADALLERKEIFGDELVDLLDSVGIRIPEIDYGDEASGRRPSSRSPRQQRRRGRGRSSAGMSEHSARARRSSRRSRGRAHRRTRSPRARSAPARAATGAVRRSSTSCSRSSSALGLGALVVLVAKPDDAPTQVWSRWQPDGSNTARVRQIADHVSTRYRFQDGEQLVVALAGPPTVTAGGRRPGDEPDPRPGDRRAARRVHRQGRGRRHHARRRLEEHAVRALRPRRRAARSRRARPPRPGTRSSAGRRSSSRSTRSSTSTTSTP